MRTIEQIMALSEPTKIYNELTKHKKPFEVPFEETQKQYDPKTHKVMDLTFRKRKKINVPTDRIDPATGERIYKTKFVDRCRVALPLQRVLVERTVGFLFSIPVEYKMTTEETEESKSVFDGVVKCFKENKIKFFDKKLARTLFRECECAELWYYMLDKNGKPTEIRVKLLSPSKGDTLYPHFDEYERMDGFARKYHQFNDDDRLEMHFDVYTKEFVYKYVQDANGMRLTEQPKRHGFGKIPVVYYRQEETEWNCVQPTIERVEELLSNWGDTNDYFGTPTYFIKGKLKGFAEKGEVGKIYQGDSDSQMSVISWDSSPASMNGELANLMNSIYSFTQTPDVSFETMKTLGSNTSGTALRLMFTDPHMKARVKIELFGEMFTRRFNLVMNAYASINAVPERVVNELEVEPTFTPYIPENVSEKIQLLTTSTGGKQIMSQEEAVRQNPLVSNADTTLEQIKAEASTEALSSLMGNAFGGAE